MTEYLYVLLISLPFIHYSITQNEVSICAVDGDFPDSFQFENIQGLHRTIVNFSICSGNSVNPTNVPLTSYMTRLLNYDHFMVQGFYSVFNTFFIPQLTRYSHTRRTLFYEVQPAIVDILNVEAFQENNPDQLLSTIDKSAIAYNNDIL